MAATPPLKSAADVPVRWGTKVVRSNLRARTLRPARVVAALAVALLLGACNASARDDDNCDMPDSTCPNQNRDISMLTAPASAGGTLGYADLRDLVHPG